MRPVIASILCAVILVLFPSVNGSLAAPLLVSLPVFQFQANPGNEYIVQPGDTLSQIARDELGDVNAWQQILDATNAKAQENEQFEAITDATVIEVGQRLWIPSPDPAEAAEEAADEPSEQPSEESSEEPAGGTTIIPDVEPTVDASVEAVDEEAVDEEAADEEAADEEATDEEAADAPSTLPTIAETIALTDTGSATTGSATTGSAATGQLLIPFSEDGRLYGYVDESGALQIEPVYAIARRFSEGLAVVSQDGVNFGYIDTSGALAIPADFSDAGPFSQGLAPVRVGDSVPKILFYDQEADEEIEMAPSGYINRTGDFEIEPKYAYAEPFRDGVALVWDEFSDRAFLNGAGETLRQKRASEPTMEGILFRSELASLLTSAPARDGLCENDSSFGEDASIWSCRVDEELFDPCFVQESAEMVWGCRPNDAGLFVCGQQPAPPALVCGYPLNPFTLSNSETLFEGVTAPIASGEFTIPHYRIRLGSVDKIDCMLIAQDSLPAAAPPQIHVCADGTFIVDDLWEVGNSGVWMARTVQLSGTAPEYEFVESTVAVVDSIWDFSTSQSGSQPAANIIPPRLPDVAYWRH